MTEANLCREATYARYARVPSVTYELPVKFEHLCAFWFLIVARVTIGKHEPALVVATPWGAVWLSSPFCRSAS